MSRPLGPSFFGKPVGQIGIVVEDLEDAIGRASQNFGAGPWRVFTYSGETLSERTFRGAPGAFSVRIALNGQSPMVEYLQPLKGPSVYHEWLEAHGSGLHHLAFWVDSLDAAIKEMLDSGFDVLQSGRGFAYFNTEPELGVVYEAVEPPRVRREPEQIVD